MAKNKTTQSLPHDDDDSVSSSSSSYDSLSSADKEHDQTLRHRRHSQEDKDDESSSSASSSSDTEEEEDGQEGKDTRHRAMHRTGKGIKDDSSQDDDNDDDDDDSHRSDSDDDDDNSSTLRNNEQNHAVASTMSLGQRLQHDAEQSAARDTLAAAATRAARERKRVAKEETAKRLAALRATKTTTTTTTDTNQKKKKTSKHRPTEVSSKRADFYNNLSSLNERGIGVELGAHKYKPRDPRILEQGYDDDTTKNTAATTTSEATQFYHNLRQQEIQQLRARIKVWKTTGKAGQKARRAMGLTGNVATSLAADQARLAELRQQVAAAERAVVNAAAVQQVKQYQSTLSARAGKKVYLKRNQVKQLTTQARLEQVRQRHGAKAVEKIVTKRRKREKSRDAKRLKRTCGSGGGATAAVPPWKRSSMEG